MVKIKKPKKDNSLIKKPTIVEENNELFLLSLKHLDRNQWEDICEWERKWKLSELIHTLHWYSNDKLISRVDKDKFTIYWDFPPKHDTDFHFPKFIPEDAKWARIHIDWKHCLIWHVIRNVFYIVFLDGKHSFWKSKLKHT